MAVISMKQLLEAGVHFGHQTVSWNQMARYIFTGAMVSTSLICRRRCARLDEAYNFLRSVAQEGEVRALHRHEEAGGRVASARSARANMYYVNERCSAAC